MPEVRDHIFISYSHKDKQWLELLRTKLESMGLNIWGNSKLQGGSLWKKKIEEAITEAKVAIILVTSNYLSDSQYRADDAEITSVYPDLPSEYKLLCNRAETNELTLLPLIVTPCHFPHSEISKYHPLNTYPNQPLSTFDAGPKRDNEILNICDKLKRNLNSLNSSQERNPVEGVQGNRSKKQYLSEQPTAPYSSSRAPTTSEQPTNQEMPFTNSAFNQVASSSPLSLPRSPSPPNTPSSPSTSQLLKHPIPAIFLFVVIILLLVFSGVMAYYSLKWHSQILSQDSEISTQASTLKNGQVTQTALAGTIQYQSTVMQNGLKSLAATNQAQSTVIKNEKATETAMSRQLSSLQATSTALAMNTPLGASFIDQFPQGPYPQISVTGSVTIGFTLKNTGTRAWTKQDGFSFICTSTNYIHHTNSGWISVCPKQNTINFETNEAIFPGQTRTFQFSFSQLTLPSSVSLYAGGIYVTYWRLAYKGLPFGVEVYMKVTITS